MSWLKKLISSAIKGWVKAVVRTGVKSKPLAVARNTTSSKARLDKTPSGKSYPVGLVGEQHHQRAIKGLEVGERVRLVHEIGNPHDSEAIAVVKLSGARIGYIPRDNFLYRRLNERGGGCTAHVKALEERGGFKQVVIDAWLTSRSIGAVDYR